MTKLKKFDATEYLNTPARQAAYLEAAMAYGDAAFARDALGIVARAYGMNKIATLAGLNRVSLYKALGKDGNPEFGTVMVILRALNMTMTVRPAAKRSRAGKRGTPKALRDLAAKVARAPTRVDA